MKRITMAIASLISLAAYLALSACGWGSWQGFFARAGTPKPIVDALNAALVADLKRPETAARFKAMGIIAQWDTPEEFRAFIAAQTEKWGKVIHDAGIEPQ